MEPYIFNGRHNIFAFTVFQFVFYVVLSPNVWAFPYDIK